MSVAFSCVSITYSLMVIAAATWGVDVDRFMYGAAAGVFLGFADSARNEAGWHARTDGLHEYLDAQLKQLRQDVEKFLD